MDPVLNNVFSYVLVVDDDQDDQFMLREALSRVVPHALIESLYDGTEAITYLEKCVTLPNLIFLDLNMARLSGQETMHIIRQNSMLAAVPVVILTTSRNEDEREKLLACGASAFYTKPASSSELLKIVQEVSARWLAVHV